MDQSQLKCIPDSISNILESRLRDSYVRNFYVRLVRSSKLASRCQVPFLNVRDILFLNFHRGIAS